MAYIKESNSSRAIKIKLVTSYPDLKVYVTDRDSEARGEDSIWCFDTNRRPQTEIKFVRSYEDLKVEYVKSRSQAGWRNKTHRLRQRIG